VKNLEPRNRKKDGYWEEYYPNGQLNFKVNYVNGQKHGYWEEYFSNGKLKYKGKYINDEKHGYWEGFLDNGRLIRIEIHKTNSNYHSILIEKKKCYPILMFFL
jgi:antitoxin component YwqK of YwqJK toxin-antitoxin module